MGIAGGAVPLGAVAGQGVRRILIVEDDDLVANSLAAVLEDLDYDVAGLAGSGPEGLEIALGGTVDLALIDVQIPGAVDGLTLAEQLNSLGIPCIIVTGAWSDRLDALNSSSTRRMALLKPFSVGALSSAIAQALVTP